MVLGALDDAGTPLKVVVLDCCRDNPFGRSWKRSGAAGLGQVTNPPTGTIIAFAAAPGSTAEDGTGTNSPFSTALAEALTQPGREIDQVFKETGRLVLAATERRQQPWVNSSFYDTFVVRAGESSMTPPPSLPKPPMSTPSQPVTNVANVAPLTGNDLRPFVLPLERGQRLAADEVEISPEVFSVGKWPEGMALIGDSLWVAESGQRTLGEFDALSGTLIERVNCGRLPVHMAAVEDRFYATINTDSKIWLQTASGNGDSIASTGSDYPEAITADETSIYVMMSIDGSSADSAAMKIDANSGKTIRSDRLGQNGADIAVGGGNLWVINNFYENEALNAYLSRLNPDTLEMVDRLQLGGRQSSIQHSDNTLYVAGGWEEYGSLVSYDARTGEALQYADYRGKMIAKMDVTDRFVVTADSEGTIFIHDRSTLIPQRTIHLGIEPFFAHDLIATPEALYLSAHLGDDGAVFKVNQWQPEGIVGEGVESRLLKAESLGGVVLNLSEADLIRLLGEPENRSEEFVNEISGGFINEANYPSMGLQVNLTSEEKGGKRIVESLSASGNSTLRTAGGIQIGNTLEEVRRVYGEYEDKIDFPVPDPLEDEFTFVAGSMYGGVIIGFKGGKVERIMLGAGAE